MVTEDLGFRPLLVVTVRGEPVPQGSKVALPMRGQKGGRPMVVDDNAKVLKPWRKQVAEVAGDAARYAERLGGLPQPLPFDGPLHVDLVITVAKPKGAPKTRITYPAVRPDVDKYLRAILDSLTQGGVIVDDGRVVRAVAEKVYPLEHRRALDEPGVHVIIARHPVGPMVDLDVVCPAPRRRQQAAQQEVLNV